MSLTNAQVQAARPKKSSYKIADSGGLFLYVTVNGAKAWRYKYRIAGREKLYSLGRYPDVSLAQARDLRDSARKLVGQGKDPVIEARKQRAAIATANEATFRKQAEAWLADQEPLWSKAKAFRVRSRLEKDVYPVIGSMPLADIDGAIILKALRKIEARGSIETAKRVRGYIHAVFKRAKGERLIDRLQLMEVDEIRDALKPARPGVKQPALTTLPAVQELQRCVARSTAGPLVKLASRLLALTVVRIGVLRTATWDEFGGIDWELPDAACSGAIWHIPAERMKLEVEDKGNAAFGHDVPLSLQAVLALRELRVWSGTSEMLFPGAKSWREPMSDSALSSLYKRMAGGRYKGRMVPHGWRSAFSTIMNEHAAELERDGDRMIIDMVLAHVPEGMSASEWAYNRARYRKSRAALLQTWGDLLVPPPPEQVRQDPNDS